MLGTPSVVVVGNALALGTRSVVVVGNALALGTRSVVLLGNAPSFGTRSVTQGGLDYLRREVHAEVDSRQAALLGADREADTPARWYSGEEMKAFLFEKHRRAD